MTNFDDEKYELNKIYDQGISDNDESVRSKIKELNSLSEQIRNENNQQRNRPYRNSNHQYRKIPAGKQLNNY